MEKNTKILTYWGILSSLGTIRLKTGFFFRLFLPFTKMARIFLDFFSVDASIHPLNIFRFWFQSFFGTTGLGLGAKYFNFFESTGEGVQFSNVGRSPVSGDGYSILIGVYMSLFSDAVFIILLWYLDNVMPGHTLFGLYSYLNSHHLCSHINTSLCASKHSPISESSRLCL